MSFTLPGSVSSYFYARGMRFRIEQRFAADVNTVCSALTNSDYLVTAMSQLPDLGAPIIESQEMIGSTVHQRLRYSFQGALPAVVTRVINPERLSWIDASVIDIAETRATFTITPIHYQSFFSCSGTWTLSPVASNGEAMALRVIEGTLRVNSPVPFVGGQVERAIVSGMKERLAKEPAVFAAWIALP